MNNKHTKHPPKSISCHSGELSYVQNPLSLWILLPFMILVLWYMARMTSILLSILYLNCGLWYGRGCMKVKISAIVPAFNEEDRIRDVLEVVTTSPLISEIICVNDGSLDNTSDVVKEFGSAVRLIDLHRNYGKGFALASGIKKAKG